MRHQQCWRMLNHPLVRAFVQASRSRRSCPWETNCRGHATLPGSPYRPVDILEDGSVNRFRDMCFEPQRPALLPRGHFRDLPAFQRWFVRDSPSATRLNYEYLQQSGETLVPLELTSADDGSFQRFNAPLSLFLQWTQAAEAQSSRLYLAQCQLSDLPPSLRDGCPTPDLVAQAGRGDIYDANIWMGMPPTYTPLHRDPNPNLFVQLAGEKVVRLLSPMAGMRVFSRVRQELGQDVGHAAAVFRGDEMMHGPERVLLEKVVWGDNDGNHVCAEDSKQDCESYEARLGAGDGLFIPNGWWHSIKGIGDGVTASVNWWFR
ncbi:JmjC domain protein [Paecilomyces variotii]|uniref:JmjC domain protein n=1 Tax=Byssochlamys spectabilis TaxID=264951 RepID=A0A443HZN4_BYSSP|nr:JmjC domain protein [Paecilomyces variotii]RWQ97305.1 JmjC domain protein [Paecilomyces variotii]